MKHLSFAILLSLLVHLCALGQINVSVALVSPAPGAKFDIGACIQLKVDIKPLPDTPVTSVRYYDGPSLIAEVVAPYRFAWNNAGRGSHTLRAVAIYDHGTMSSNNVTISINDPTTPVDLINDVDNYNVTFTTLGKTARESMPLGNGDISVNAWTYENGDIGLLIGKLDAFSGVASSDGFFSLRKIGRVRIALYPPVFKQAADKGIFKQALVLSEAAIKFVGQGSELTLWVDKNHPVVRAQLSGKTKVTMTISDDPWRTSKVAKTHEADTVFSGLPNQVAWCYHDPRTDTDYRNAHEKGAILMGAPGSDMLPKITTVSFGALIEGEGLKSVDALTLRSGNVTHCRADINILRYSKLNEATPAKWLTMMKAQAAQNRSLSATTAWNDHLLWWKSYWDRNYLVISGGPKHEDVTSHYLHLRFMNACQTGPMKELWRIPFNGGILNVDFMDVDMGKDMGPNVAKGVGVNPQMPETMMTPDFRLWGASDRPQNARHVYWPMLQTGDYDQARAWFLWPAIVSRHWQKTVEDNTDLRGAFISVGCSGWESLSPSLFVKRDNQVASRIIPAGIGEEGGSRNFCFDAADEYLPYMIDYYELTRDEDFLANQLLPYTEGLFRFFDNYFTRDNKGKLVLWPCMTSEAYVRFPSTGYVPANPMGGVALIHSQLPRLLALKGKPGVSAEILSLWQRVYDARPDMPVAIRRNDLPGLAPHEPDYDIEQQKTQGADRATLYAIWPYRTFMFPESGTSTKDFELAKNTLALDDNGSWSWAYGDYCAAILGNSERARNGVLKRMNGTDGYFRFPAFSYNQSPDWVPNVEAGNVILSTLNYMLWNWKGDQIFLCPAWPKDWDCKFKFHAPHNTLVQGHVTSGTVTIDNVVPESRRCDIVILKPQ